MPTSTTSIDHMIYTLSEIAFYCHYHPAQPPSTSPGSRSKGGKGLSGKTRIRDADRLLMVEKGGVLRDVIKLEPFNRVIAHVSRFHVLNA